MVSVEARFYKSEFWQDIYPGFDSVSCPNALHPIVFRMLKARLEMGK